jgi:hypothetical protein
MELGFDNSFHWSPLFLNILQKIREGEGDRKEESSEMSVARQRNHEQFRVCTSCYCAEDYEVQEMR